MCGPSHLVDTSRPQHKGMTAATLVLIAPCSLLLGAALQILVARLCSARTKGILAFLACLPALVATVGLVPVDAVQCRRLTSICCPWDGPLALVLHVDALSVLFAFMGASIGGLVLLYSISYMAHDKAATRFYCAMLVFIGGFISLVFSANLFIFYLCWELVGLCSFSLVGFWYTNPEAVAGARKVLLMTHIAGYGLLAAILVLYHRTGSALWTNPNLAHSFTTGIFLLMLVALVAKSVQVPLHTWIPEAMAAPTPVSALLHAACYVTSGVYLAARMHSFGIWPIAWGATLIWIGTVTMAVGVMYAMVQTDLKRMLAFSTVSQIGYMMLGIGIGTPLAITAGLLHCLNHGFFKGGLFLTAGSVQHAAGTRDMNKLGGLAQKMPHTTFSWFIGVGSMMGIPLMSGFASKWMLYAAALQAGWAVPAMVAWAVSLGTVFLGAKATSAVFLGPLTAATKDAHESPSSMVWGMGLLAAGSIVLGIAPQLAVNYLLNPILGALGLGAGVHVTWLGMSADAGSFSTTGGLVLAVVSLVLGGAIYAVAYAARQTPATVAVTSGGAAMAGAGGGIFTGGEPLSDQGRLTAGDFSDPSSSETGTSSSAGPTSIASTSPSGAPCNPFPARSASPSHGWNSKPRFLVVVLAALILAAVRWFAPGVALELCPLALRSPCPDARRRLRRRRSRIDPRRARAHKDPRPRWPHGPRRLSAAIAGLSASDPWIRLGLLELGALLTIPAGLANRPHALRKTHLHRRRRHLGSLARRKRSAPRARATRMGACLAAHQRLRQARCGPALLLAPQAWPTNSPPSSSASSSPSSTWPHSASCTSPHTPRPASSRPQASGSALPPQLHSSPRCSCSPSAASSACSSSPLLKTSASSCSASPQPLTRNHRRSGRRLHPRPRQGPALHLPQRPRSRRRSRRQTNRPRHALPRQRLRIPLRHAGHARHSAHHRLHRPLEAL